MPKTEQQIQANKIKDLEAQGFYVIKLMKTNKNGIPDLLVLPPNTDTFFVEVKRPGGKISALQKYRIEELSKKGIRTEIHTGE